MAARKHSYQTTIAWTGNTGKGTATYSSYERSYDIKIIGKPIISGSSDPAFRGDAAVHNPEELLLAAISSCHMLWYLHLCAEAKIVVTHYNDEATATMEELANGSGRFTEVLLRPQVTITESYQIDLAQSLHAQANAMCFIANSLRCEVLHHPTIFTNPL